MSGQNKFGKINPDYEDYLSRIKALAKMCYKLIYPNNTSSFSKNKGINNEFSLLIDEYINNDSKYKHDITSWLSGLDNKEFIKLMVIDNKWATEMIIQMYHLVQKKNYHFCCKNRDLDKDQEYNRFKESIMTKNIKNQSINLDWFFEYKDYKEKKQELEDDNPGQNFISFIRIFSLYEKNDSFTFSKEYCDFSTVSHYLNEFSNKQSFNSLCRVECESKKNYQFGYPKWFNNESYNTFCEFISAIIEKELSAKFLYFKQKEIKGDNIVFPIKTNEFFTNIENLAQFLKEEFRVDNQKQWSKFSEKLELKKIVLESRGTHDFKQSDEYKNTIKIHHIKFNTNAEEENLEGDLMDLLEEVKKAYLDKNEDKFLNDLVFSKLDKNSQKQAFHKSILEKIRFLHSEKIVLELINDNEVKENIGLKKQKISKKKKDKTVTQNLSEEKDNIYKTNSEIKQKIDNLSNDPIEIYKSHYLDISVNKLKNNDEMTSEQINPNLNFLIQLDSIEKKNKKLQQMVLDKKCSLEKKIEENSSNTDFLTIINTESVEKLNESTNYSQLDKINNNCDIQITDIDKEKTLNENTNDISKDIEDEENSNKKLVEDTKLDTNSLNDEKIEDINKKKKKHRDTKKKNKVNSKEFLSKSVKFYRTVSDLYKYNSPTPINPPKKTQPKEEKKQEETLKFESVEKPEIEEPHIKINKLENLTINKKVENLTITKPVNDPNTIVLNEKINSPFIQNPINISEKLNSPFVNNQLNQPNRLNSPFVNRSNGNINEKIRSPFTNKYNDISNLAKNINNSPTPREDIFLPNQQHSQFYPNNTFYQPLENKNKFTNKYNNLAPQFENNEGMLMVNGIRNPIGNNYLYMNTQFMQPIMTPNIAFNFPINNSQFPSNNNAEIPFMTNFKKYELNDRNYFNKLHNDIIEYSNNINTINDNLKEIKIFLIQFVENKLKEFLIKYNLKIAVSIYGSFKTDLSIETSDIDLSINFLNALNLNKEYVTNLISDLSVQFEKLFLFEKVVALTNATVPIIKLEIDPSKVLEQNNSELYEKFAKLKESDIFINYKFDLEEINKIKIDLNFTENITTSLAVNWARTQVLQNPEIRPIIQVVKRYILNNKLNDAYKGGLSSYSLLITIVFYFKTNRKKENLGEILYEYFKLFGEDFDFTKYGIDVTQSNPKFVLPYFFEFSLFIKDPINPQNNVAKSSYKFDAIKQMFSNAYRLLKQYNTSYTSDGEDIDNIIYDFLINKKYN